MAIMRVCVVDLTVQTTTEKMIRKQLEAELKVDLNDRRKYIRQQVHRPLNASSR